MERRSIFPATLLKRLLQGLGGLALLITFGNCSESDSGDRVAFVATTAASCDAHSLNPGGSYEGQNLVYICPGHPVRLCWSAATHARSARIEPEVGNVIIPFGTAMVQPTQSKEYRFSGTHNDPAPVEVTVVVNGSKVSLIGRQCSSPGGAVAYCYDAGQGAWDPALHATSIVVDSNSASCFANTRWSITHTSSNGERDSTNATTNTEVNLPASWSVEGDWKFVPTGPCTQPPAVLNFRVTCACQP